MSDCHVKIDKNKTLVMRYVKEVQEQHSLSTIGEIFAEDFVDHSRVAGGMFDGGLAQLSQGLASILGAFPDLEVTINHLLAEGDKVVAHKSFRATHLGPWMGVAATGKRVEWELISIYGIRDDKISDYWGILDDRRLNESLGLPL
ncbi:ester cyclase [Roseovarius sp. THAF27]|uniref:ester cyclase n=1 Tax=Roseovarius sp. THAF27 TaxID=2587850 RepID=UPI001562955C|nr:ester cyclase [Roseovarius sp. THAF27]